MGMARHPQSTQNNKFVISLKKKKKEGRDKYLLHEVNHQSFLQASSIVFTCYSQACSKYPE